MSKIVDLDAFRRNAPPARPLPHNIELEQALLGALLVNNAVLDTIGPRLEAEHFFEPLHRSIFDVASRMIRDGQPVTPVTMKTFLPEMALESGTTIGQYLARLYSDAGPVINAPAYARGLVDLHIRRCLIAEAAELDAQSFDPPVDLPVEKVIDGIESRLMDLRTRYAPAVQTRGLAGEMAEELLAKVERIQSGAERKLGVPTGIGELDRDTGGFQPGTLWIIAGRPGMGKTICATNLARSAAAPRNAAGALLISLEVPREQIVARLLADLAFMHSKPLTFGQILLAKIDDEDKWRLQDATRRLRDMPLIIDSSSRLSVAQIASRVRFERQRLERQGSRLGVVIIDYLKFVSSTDRYQGQRHYEVGEISAGLKQLAKDQSVCIVLLAQLNRAVEARPDKRPGLADLRESGDLEADADVVGFVYRESYYLEQSPAFRNGDQDAVDQLANCRDQMDFIIGKNRAGATRTHRLWCDIAHSAIAEHARNGGF